MKRLLFLLTVMLMLCSCKDAPPERFTEVYGKKFGKIDYEREVMHVKQQVISKEDILELSITPQSKIVWRISLIVPEFPGDSEMISAAKKFIADEFSVKFNESNLVELPGTVITVEPAFEFGPRAVRISFTDREFEELYRRENAMPETALNRKKELARTEILIFEKALRDYHNENGSYPEKLENLITAPAGAVNWRGPYWNSGRELPVDPWGRAYVYRRNGDGFELFSTGESGREVLR